MTVSSAATEAQKNLMDASYRGVPFYVTSTKLKVGRRVVLFEYPQQDKPFVEDLGRAARIVTVEAFTTGRDYVERMSALVKALETQGALRSQKELYKAVWILCLISIIVISGQTRPNR